MIFLVNLISIIIILIENLIKHAFCDKILLYDNFVILISTLKCNILHQYFISFINIMFNYLVF